MIEVKGKVKIFNMPYEKAGFVVARQDSGCLWYYGCYDTEDRAKDVAVELGNGVVIEVET